MHSRIFQISKEPIEKRNYITESDYYDHWFLDRIADYIDDYCDRDASIGWLCDCAKGYEINKDNTGGYCFIVHSKEEYFKDKYDVFMSELKKIGMPTIDQFANGIDLWRFQDAYNDQFGFYVQTNSDDLMTFDEFVRHCNENDCWYIGGVLDYHF